jgi:hypothetical protein
MAMSVGSDGALVAVDTASLSSSYTPKRVVLYVTVEREREEARAQKQKLERVGKLSFFAISILCFRFALLSARLF